MATLHLACAARGDYVAHSAAMLHSVGKNAGTLRVHAHFLHEPGLARETQHDLRAMVEGAGGEMTFHRIDPQAVAGLPSTIEFTEAMWYRVLLPELLPDLPRILYLDVDTLAVDDLGPLWETELGDNYVAAVSNVLQHNHVHRPASLGIPEEQGYFNSGVLLMNLDAMRRNHCAERVVDCATERGAELEWPDQDALNLILGPKRVHLHPRWNCMNSVLNFPSAADVFGADQVEEARSNPGIRHFEGPAMNKPWHRRSDPASVELYRRHRVATPWPNYELEGRELGLMRRLLRR